jgi:hypothetical protein
MIHRGCVFGQSNFPVVVRGFVEALVRVSRGFLRFEVLYI